MILRVQLRGGHTLNVESNDVSQFKRQVDNGSEKTLQFVTDMGEKTFIRPTDVVAFTVVM